MPFQKAVKHEAKLRLSLAGPSGSGKTYTALTLATALADGQPIAVIDTERGSASKYSDIFSFDVMELDTFHPEKFVAGIKEAQEAGYAVLVIDSLSHAWNGTGGLLDIVDGIAKRRYNGNTFAAWKDATPLQNQLIDTITGSTLHVIVTMRAKQEYSSEKNEKTGKTEVKKLGMAPIQRDGMEYEFDIAADMDIDNTMIVQKSRCSALSGQIIPKPDDKVADILKVWLSGEPASEKPKEVQQSSQLRELLGRAKNRAVRLDLAKDAATWLAFIRQVTGIADLEEKDLTVAHVGTLNGHMAQIERDSKVPAEVAK